MIIDRKHVAWGVGTAIASGAVALVYYANTDPAALERHGLHLPLPAWLGPSPPLKADPGSTPLGLIYGSVALAIFIFAALLGARRNLPTLPFGPIKAWLRAHIWLTIFTIPLVIFHCGYLAGGAMTEILLGLYILVMVSGFWGLFLQNVLPRFMRAELAREVIFEQIPYVRTQLIAQAEKIRDDLSRKQETLVPAGHADAGSATAPVVDTGAATARMAIKRFADQEVLPYLASENVGRSNLRTQDISDGQFRLLQLQLPDQLYGPLAELKDLCDEKRRLDLQIRLHYWLHGWLIFHAPASILLVFLTIVHAIVATLYYSS